MRVQSEIQRTLSEPAALERLAERFERITLPAAGAAVPGGGQLGPLEDGVGLVALALERLEDVWDLALVRVAEPT